MSDTTVSSANVVGQWADDFFVEMVRESRFKRYMGKGENKIIQVKEDLIKEAGDQITLSLVSRLTGSGVTGDNTLEGNEENLGNQGHKITVNQIRHGVVVGEFEKIKTKIDLLNAAKTMLKLWYQEQDRDLIIARMQSPVTDGLTTYASATEAQKDAWEAANNPSGTNQRILFGAAMVSSTLDHSAGLAEIDGTADDLHQDIVALMKRLAVLCDPRIRPVVDETGNEQFVLFVGSLALRDLQANMAATHREADVRGMENKLFAGGDIKYGNVIVHEEPAIPTITGVGASAIDVQPTFLCGAQALGFVWAARPEPRLDQWDYGNRRGAAIRSIRGCEKMSFANGGANPGPFQHGMVTGYVSAVGD